MGKVTLDKSMSLDVFITGPNPGPLGEGGDRLFAWFMINQSEENFIRDNEIIGEAFESGGAVIMGKRSFEIVDGPEGWRPIGPRLDGRSSCSHRIRVKGSIRRLFGSRESLRFARFGSREKRI